MRIFQGKYLVVSLVIHLAVISSFLLFQKSSEEAETSMLVTEIIQIKEPDKLKDVKTDNHKTKVVKKTSIVKGSKVKAPDIQAVLKPKTSPVTFKPGKVEFEQKTVDVKQASVEEKPKKSSDSLNKKSNDNRMSQNKNLSKALYKIGSINNPHPPYPLIARKKGFEGKLILEVLVNEDGSVKSTSIRESSGYEILDTVSKKTVEKWTFIPAKKMGQAVKDNIQVPIKFVLTD
jgi:protein TonB